MSSIWCKFHTHLLTAFKTLEQVEKSTIFSTADYAVFSTAYGESALITTTLTLTRALVISDPFRRIRKRVVLSTLFVLSLLGSTVIFAPLLISFYTGQKNEAVKYYTSGYLLAADISISSVSTACIIRCLKTCDIKENNEVQNRNYRVSVTVIGIATAFVVTNITGMTFLLLVVTADINKDIYFPIRYFSFLLNSALNPLIFILMINKFKFRCYLS